MTPARLALLLAPALPLGPALLILSACGETQTVTGERRETPVFPWGFELAVAGAGASAADAATVTAPAPAPVLALSPEDLAVRLRAGNIRLIDLRTDEEIAGGFIPGAEHIPFDRFDPAALDLADGRAVVLYCRSGNRSAEAGARLAAATGGPAEHLDGGILAWEAAGQPVGTL